VREAAAPRRRNGRPSGVPAYAPDPDRSATPGSARTPTNAQLLRENGTLRLVVAIHDRLGALVLQGADATAITDALSDLVARPVVLLDTMMRTIALHGRDEDGAALQWQPTEAYISRVLQTMAGERRAMRLPPLPAWGVAFGCVLAPIVAGDSTLGYLAILEAEAADSEPSVPAEADLLAAQHAASVYALALMRERLAAEVTTELRDELLEGLLDGQVTDEQATRERARRLGYDESLTYQVLSALPEESGVRAASYLSESNWSGGWLRRVLESVGQMVRERAPEAIVSRRRDELVVIAPQAEGVQASDLGRSITLYVASMYPEWPLTVGIGGECSAPRDIARSYAQARRSAEVALRFGRKGEVVSFEELGFYRLLFQIEDRGELRAFVEQVLGPLLAYDQKHRTDFVRTISSYLSNNNSLQATAKELYVHVNTAAYRLQRIQAITGLDLSKTEDCLLARVALMILEDDDTA
jgi:PucR family transcriptional regulator, purine catabolism regulatory protein